MSIQNVVEIKNTDRNLPVVLSKLQAAYKADPAPTYEQRVDRLSRLHAGLMEYKDQLIAAVDHDFNGRAHAETMLAEILPILEGIRYYRKNLRKLMGQSKRHLPLMLLGAHAKVHY
ncbi:hypothetical protein J7400_20960 [Shimia sp. R9_2]|uniref:hypothetical protein n=1 Tax=Shimia sp. R9_2 TaxID=2821112 RepID=UPI001AD9A55D|nr:hypothetical protein [Shimia sp. R9_2]MBO9399153.1 hypothetical protein [Shimia sp. R9_2]